MSMPFPKVDHQPSYMDLPENQEIAAAIVAAGREVKDRTPFVDRRNVVSLRAELGRLQHRGNLQEAELVQMSHAVVTLTGKLVAARKLAKKADPVVEGSHHTSALRERIWKGESDLAELKDREDRLTKICASIKKQIMEFLDSSPGKGFKTNYQLLQDLQETDQAERQVAGSF
jgi:hypothetical protein